MANDKEMHMAMAVKLLSKEPLDYPPDDEDYAEVGMLLTMAYENWGRFISFGMQHYRNYRLKRMKKKLKEAKKC